MTNSSSFTAPSILLAFASKSTWIGAGIGLILITAFLLTTGEPNPEWGGFWRIRPIVVLPIAGAMGGAFFHFMFSLCFRKKWIKCLAILAGIIGFIVALWLGSVVGLDGTYWH